MSSAGSAIRRSATTATEQFNGEPTAKLGLSTMMLYMNRLVRVAAPALFLSMLSCKDPCSTTCAKVASCKLEAKQGAPMLGEGALPPDPVCMDRCQKNTVEFRACEGKKRECGEVLACLPVR